MRSRASTCPHKPEFPSYMLHSREIFIGPRFELKHGFELAARRDVLTTAVDVVCNNLETEVTQ